MTEKCWVQMLNMAITRFVVNFQMNGNLAEGTFSACCWCNDEFKDNSAILFLGNNSEGPNNLRVDSVYLRQLSHVNGLSGANSARSCGMLLCNFIFYPPLCTLFFCLCPFQIKFKPIPFLQKYLLIFSAVLDLTFF